MKTDWASMFIVIHVCVSIASSDVTEIKKKRKGCRCLKRYAKEIDTVIDGKMEKFQTWYAMSVNSTLSSVTKRLREETENGDIELSISDEFLKLNFSLNSVKDSLKRQTRDLHVFSEKLLEMEEFIQNISRFVLTQPTSSFLNDSKSENSSLFNTRVYPKDCQEVFESGGMKFKGDYYILIKPYGMEKPFKVRCSMFNNSGWTVIQRRQDGSIDFFRKWRDYESGFGNLEGEFWLGNRYIHALTSQGRMQLRIDMEDWTGKHLHAEYSHFLVDGPKENYRLHIGGYTGNAGDSMTSYWENHDGMMFSTHDNDNDGRYYDNCAKAYHGAWWFNNCFDSNLNGKYYHKGFHSNYFQRDGIQWNSIHMYSSLKYVEMKIKPSNDI